MPKFFILLTLMAASHVPAAFAAASATDSQDPALVAAEVETFLRGQASNYPGSIQISIDTPRITRQTACEQMQAFLPTGQRLRSRMTVGVRCTAPEAWTSYVQANLGVQGFYYVANHTIQPGDTLELDDLSTREGDLLRLSPGIVFDPSHVVGHIATQRLTAGSPIKSAALRNPQSIQRGQAVRTEARGQGFVARGEGKALQSGAPGTQIQVRSSSGQIVNGTVLNSNTVQVIM